MSENIYIFFRIEILLHLDVPNIQILLHFNVPDNQFLLHFGVPNNQIFSIWLSPTTALLAKILLGYIRWAGVGDTELEKNVVVGDIKKSFKKIVWDTKMELNLVVGTPKWSKKKLYIFF